MELLLVGLAWILLGGLVMGGAAVLLEYESSGSLLDPILDGLRQFLPSGDHPRPSSSSH
jgi:hypothetical protein